MLRRHVTLIGVLAVCACGGAATAPSASPPAHVGVSPSPKLPAAATITATISTVGPLTKTDDYFGIAGDSSAVWVYNGETGVLSKLSTATNQVVSTLTLPVGCKGGLGCGNVAVGAGGVWVADVQDGTILRVDPTTDKLVATIHVEPDAGPQVYVAGGQVWVANYTKDEDVRIDPATNKIVKTVSDNGGAESVIYADGSLWFCDAGRTPGLVRVDPTTDAMQAEVDLTQGGHPYECFDAAATSTALLVAAVSSDGGLYESVNAANQASAGVAPGRHGVERGLAADATAGWAVDSVAGIYRLDPQSARPVGLTALSGAAGVAVAAGSVWVASANGTVYRLSPAA